jgi:uncharacterized damage-inducible protein DinB
MNKDVASRLENWKFHRGLALDILKSLTDDHLMLTVGKNMGTLGEQFRHMVRVEIQYVEAIITKKIDVTKKKIDPGAAQSKNALLKLWQETSREMLTSIEKLSQQEANDLAIDWKYWGYDKLNLADHLQALSDHECLHNGEIIVYLKTHKIPFPKSWESWGLM